MQTKGINFDTGFLNKGTSTREPFDTDVVRREMQIIRDDLHCTDVRITGGNPDRLEIAARHAGDAGLEVWLCPFTNGLSQDDLLALLADCAERAEQLRRSGAQVVMCTGSEVSLFTTGFFPGDTLEERLAVLTDPVRVRAAVPQVRAQMKSFLQRAVEIVRARFGGRVSYASLPFEAVDWTLFDIIATDAGYRNATTRASYPECMRAYVERGRALGKPVAITEFGCVAYRGAGDAAGSFDPIVWDDHAHAIGLKGDFVRDEEEQATHVREVLDVYDSVGIDAAFVYTFARYDLPHRAAPNVDLDMASAGVVKVLDDPSIVHERRYPDMPWEPKAAFDTIAEVYGRSES